MNQGDKLKFFYQIFHQYIIKKNIQTAYDVRKILSIILFYFMNFRTIRISSNWQMLPIDDSIEFALVIAIKTGEISFRIEVTKLFLCD